MLPSEEQRRMAWILGLYVVDDINWPLDALDKLIEIEQTESRERFQAAAGQAIDDIAFLLNWRRKHVERPGFVA